MSNAAIVTIGGSTVTSQVRLGSVRIDDVLNETPNTAEFLFDGSAPTIGAEVKIGLGTVSTADLLFAGVIVSIEQAYEGKAVNPVWQVSCQDYTFTLNQARPFGIWSATSATTIAQSLITSYAAGFTSAGVQSSLASVSIVFNGSEDLATCLTRLATLAGAYWYVDYAKDLHFFTSEAAGSPDTVGDQSGTKLLHDPPIAKSTDLSQIRTRVYVVGAGVQTLGQLVAGATKIPVDDSTIFASGGGQVRIGAQVITYTGKTSNTKTGSRVNSYPGPPPTVTINTGLGGQSTFSPGDTFSFCIRWLVSASLTPPTVGSAPITAVSDGAGACYAIRTTKPATPTGATEWALFMRKNGGSWYRWSSNFLVSLTFLDWGNLVPGGGFWALEDPTLSKATNTNIVGSDPIPVGATQVGVQDVTQFSSTGGVAVAAGQVITYTGLSATTGFGALIGVPSSGYGSVTAEIPSGSLITNAPTLVGIPSSGTGSVTATTAAGEQCRIFVQRDDTTAQGTYGIYEHLIDDSTLISDADCQARGDADLALFKNPITTFTYRTRDVKSRSGKTVTVSFSGAPSYSGTYKIVRVVIDQIDVAAGRMAPRFTVTASTVKYSLSDLLRRAALAVN